MTKREFRWVFLFSLLSILVGFCGGMLAERVTDASAGSQQKTHRSKSHRGGLSSVSDLADELLLRDEQRSEVERIVREATEAMREHEAKSREIGDLAREAMMDVLDADQRAKLEAERDRDRAEWRKRTLDNEVRKWTAILELSEDQAAPFRSKIGAVLDKKHAFYRTRCEKGASPSRDEARAFSEQCRAEKIESLRGVLTPAQFERYRKVESSEGYEGGR